MVPRGLGRELPPAHGLTCVTTKTVVRTPESLNLCLDQDPDIVDINRDDSIGLADVSLWVNNFEGFLTIPVANGTFLPPKPAACNGVP